MQFCEYGDSKNPVVLMIHGMGMTADRSFGAAKDRLQDRFRIILVALDGYEDSTSTFSSIATQAKQIADYVNAAHAGAVYATLGMSMGGLIMTDLLCRHGIRTERAIFDSGYMLPMPCPRVTASLVAWGYQRLLRDRPGLLVSACVKKLMGGYCYKPDELCGTASRETIFNSFLCCHTYRLPDTITSLNGIKTFFLYGDNETVIKKGMRTLKAYLPDLHKICLGKTGHGECMLTDPDRYTAYLLTALEQ